MLRSILAICKARYALTALLVYGAVHAYSFVGMLSQKLPALPLSSALWKNDASDPNSAVQQPESDMGPITTAVTGTHPLLRAIYWSVGYGLLCLAGAPVIRWALARESNVTNAVLILAYAGAGGLMAFALMAFRCTWTTGIVGVLAFLCAAAGIIRIAGEMERFRVENMAGSG